MSFDWFYAIDIVQDLVWFVLLVLVVVTVTAVRGEDDPAGRRPRATYLAVVLGFSLVVGVLSSATAVRDLASSLQDEELTERYEDDEEFMYSSFEVDVPGREDNYADALRGALLAAAAFVVFAVHRRRLAALLDEPGAREGEVGRVAEGAAHVMSFLGLMALAGGAALAVHGLVRLAAPGTFSSEDADLARKMAAEGAFVGAWLALVGVGIVGLHRDPLAVRPAPEGEPPDPPAEEAPIA